MNHPQILSWRSVAKIRVLFATAILFFAGCKKNAVKEDPVIPTQKEIVFKTDEWKVYPNFGGPGEDSMYNSFSPQLVNSPLVLRTQTLKKVIIKSKSGSLYPAKQFISVSQNDSGYLYQFGESFSRPGNLLLWWIQKQPGARPDADSAFITLQY